MDYFMMSSARGPAIAIIFFARVVLLLLLRLSAGCLNRVLLRNEVAVAAAAHKRVIIMLAVRRVSVAAMIFRLGFQKLLLPVRCCYWCGVDDDDDGGDDVDGTGRPETEATQQSTCRTAMAMILLLYNMSHLSSSQGMVSILLIIVASTW